jgi:hypothetical protein
MSPHHAVRGEPGCAGAEGPTRPAGDEAVAVIAVGGQLLALAVDEATTNMRAQLVVSPSTLYVGSHDEAL